MVARPFIYQGHTNLTAIIEPTLLIVLFLLFHRFPKKKSFISYILFIVFIYIIDFSCSRASFVTTLITLGAFFLLLPHRRKIGFAVLVTGTIISSYWIRYANDYYHENYVRQPLKPYDPKDRTTWKGTTTYSIPIDDDQVIKYREEHGGKLVYEDAIQETEQEDSTAAPSKDTIKEVAAVTEKEKEKPADKPISEEVTIATPAEASPSNTEPLPSPKPSPPTTEETPTEVIVEGKKTDEIFALTTEERLNRAPISETNKELDILNFDDNQSNVERKNRWLAGIYFFQENPIFGIGVGTFSDHYLSHYYGKGLVEKPTVVSSKKMNIHNLYLGWLTEGGIVLGLAGLLLVFYAIKTQAAPLFIYGLSWRGIKKYHKRLIIIKGLMLIYFCSFFLHAVVQDFANESRVIVIFWACMALLNSYKVNSFKSTGK